MLYVLIKKFLSILLSVKFLLNRKNEIKIITTKKHPKDDSEL